MTCNRDQKVRLDTSLSVWVIEAKGVPLRKKYFCELLLDKVLFGRTSVKLKNDMLFWGEKFVFEDLPPTESLTISLFRESDVTKKKRHKDKHSFVGSSVVDLLSMETNVENEKWVSVFVPGISPKLQQKTVINNSNNNSSSGKNDKSSSADQQPFIRARFKYETTIVLPLTSYRDLHDYVRKHYLLLVSTLESGISLKIKDLLAQTMLKILQANNSAELFLVDIIMNEVCNTVDENLTFRGNSLATKSIDTYMKMIGKSYLQDTLGAFVNSVYENEDDSEVDPQKITSPSNSSNSSSNSNTNNAAILSNNQQFLKKLLQGVWKSITDSTQIFPVRLRRVFSLVRERCEAKGIGCISKKITSASLFLRFLCPAILSPSLFQLSREYPVERVSRTLTLVAKTVQNLANFTRFGTKESYMEFLNEFVEQEMPNMDKFLHSVSILDDDCHDSCSAADENIDLSRALSILYHILQAEIPGLSRDDRDKLSELMPILRQIAEIHEASPKVDELRLSRPFATAASVCSKPLTTPLARDDTTSSAAPSSSNGSSSVSAGSTSLSTSSSRTIVEDIDEDVINTDCYRDTALSFNEDYVSAGGPDGVASVAGSGFASLPTHRKSPSRNLAKLNEGRGTIDRKKLQLSSRSTPDINGVGGGRRSKSVDINMSGSRLLNNDSNFSKYSKPQTSSRQNANNNKSEPSLNSLKRRQFEQQQQQQLHLQQQQQQYGSASSGTPKSPIRKGVKDLSSNSVRDRISMFSSPKSSSSTNPSGASTPSTPTSPNGKMIMSPKSGLANKTFFSSTSSNNNSNHRYQSIPPGSNGNSRTSSHYHSLSKPSKTSSPIFTNHHKTNTLPSSKSSSISNGSVVDGSNSCSIPLQRSAPGTAATSTPPGLRKPPHQTNTPPQSRTSTTTNMNNSSTKDISEKSTPDSIPAKKPLVKSQSLVLSPKPALRPKPMASSGSQLSLQRPVVKKSTTNNNSPLSTDKLDKKKSKSTANNSISNKEDRPKLTLSNLRKEHNFSEDSGGIGGSTTSSGVGDAPELMSYERSPKRTYSDRGVDVFGDAIAASKVQQQQQQVKVNGGEMSVRDQTGLGRGGTRYDNNKYSSVSSRTGNDERKYDYDDFDQEDGWDSSRRVPPMNGSGVGSGSRMVVDDLDSSSDTIVVAESSALLSSKHNSHHHNHHNQSRYRAQSHVDGRSPLQQSPQTSLATSSPKDSSTDSRKTKSGASVQRRHSELSPRELEKKRNINNGQQHQQRNNGNPASLVAHSHADIAHVRHHSANSNGVLREELDFHPAVRQSDQQHRQQHQQKDANRSLVVENGSEVLHEGYITSHQEYSQQQQNRSNQQHQNSVSSLEYSSCEDDDEFSSDSYYTSEDDLDFGEIIEGDSIDDVLKEHQRTVLTNGDGGDSRLVRRKNPFFVTECDYTLKVINAKDDEIESLTNRKIEVYF